MLGLQNYWNVKKPRLIDEWQEAPVLWDAVRNSVDEICEDGFIY